MTHAIEAEGLVRRFGKTTALAGVDFSARAGTVFGLLGIHLRPEVPPLSNLAGYLSPYWLAPNLAMRKS